MPYILNSTEIQLTTFVWPMIILFFIFKTLLFHSECFIDLLAFQCTYCHTIMLWKHAHDKLVRVLIYVMNSCSLNSLSCTLSLSWS